MNEQERLFEEVKDDLDKALDIVLTRDWQDVREGQTIWKEAGSVTKLYTLVESLASVPMGEPMTWRIHYISHRGTVMWLNTTFDRRAWRHEIEDEFSVYPT